MSDIPTIGFVSLGCPKALTDSELILTQPPLTRAVLESGETWLSELDDADLHELITLGADAVLEDDA